MSVPRYHLDSNVLLRFLIGEPHDQFAAASALFQRAEHGEVVLELSPLVLAETAFTLESFYKRPRREVAKVVFMELGDPGGQDFLSPFTLRRHLVADGRNG